MLMLSSVRPRTYVSWPFHDMAEGHDHFLILLAYTSLLTLMLALEAFNKQPGQFFG